MFRSIVGGMLLVGATVALVCGSATAAQKGKPVTPANPGKAGSAKWDYTVVDEQDKLVETGVFFAKNSQIINALGKQVGTYEDVSETHVTGEVKRGKLLGKMDLRRETPTSNTWHGELVRPAGAKYKITVVFEKMK